MRAQSMGHKSTVRCAIGRGDQVPPTRAPQRSSIRPTRHTAAATSQMADEHADNRKAERVHVQALERAATSAGADDDHVAVVHVGSPRPD
jgi:hypothetical protein